MKNPLLRHFLKLIFTLAALVIVFGFLAHILAGSETLTDYSVKKAQAAYDGGDTHIDEKKEEQADKEMQTAKQDETAPGAPESNDTDEKEETPQIQEPEIPDSRIVYQDGFYYEELNEPLKERITGISYPVTASDADSLAVPAVNILADNTAPAVSYDDLRYLHVLHYNFNGEVQGGELICNKGIVEDLAEIFYQLYLNEYQIEKIKLIDAYQGDDTASMTDNNTSCFNYRVVDGTANLSKHALGCAIDINPFYNPYVVFNRSRNGETYISPAGSEIYADRSKEFPYKIDENDLCYKLFTEHGFVWGGNWNSCNDYQHFQKVVD